MQVIFLGLESVEIYSLRALLDVLRCVPNGAFFQDSIYYNSSRRVERHKIRILFLRSCKLYMRIYISNRTKHGDKS